MTNLIKITAENFKEIEEKINAFIGDQSFIQTHDWIINPLKEHKKYFELDFGYPKYKYNSDTVAVIHGDHIVLEEKDFSPCDECDGFCEDSCNTPLDLAYIGDEIEFFEDALNVISYGWDQINNDDFKEIIVWRLYR